MAAISLSIRALVTSPPRVSPSPVRPSSVWIRMTRRVQSALAPPDQRIGATKGTLTTSTSIREIFIAGRFSSPRRPAGNDQVFARDAPSPVAAEEKGQRCDLARFDQPLLRIALGDHPQILLYIP